jgi:drug/metabolite transporter (DMT)-like permease
LGGALLMLAVSPLVPGGIGGLGIPNFAALGLLIALGVTSFFVAPMLYFFAIRRAGLVLPAILMATIPVFTLGLTATILGIVPPTLAILGIPVALAGAILAASGDHPPWDRLTSTSAAPPSSAPTQNP